MWCFLLLKKLFLQHLKFHELCYHGRNILCISDYYFHLVFCILWRKFHSFLFFYQFHRIYDNYFLLQLISEPNLHSWIFIFIQAYLWNHGASVTCVNDGNSKLFVNVEFQTQLYRPVYIQLETPRPEI